MLLAAAAACCCSFSLPSEERSRKFKWKGRGKQLIDLKSCRSFSLFKSFLSSFFSRSSFLLHFEKYYLQTTAQWLKKKKKGDERETRKTRKNKRLEECRSARRRGKRPRGKEGRGRVNDSVMIKALTRGKNLSFLLQIQKFIQLKVTRELILTHSMLFIIYFGVQ